MKPQTSYLICATPRCGSTLLCEALTNTRIAGRPLEYFNGNDELRLSKTWGVSSYADYLEKVIAHGTTPNGIFGAKIVWMYLHDLIRRVRRLPQYKGSDQSAPEFLTTVFPNLHYIWIIRDDRVRQAVSLDIAIQTGMWSWRDDEPPVVEKQPIFSFKRIDQLYYRILAYEAAWQKYFITNSVTPFHVTYERLVEAYDQTIVAILQYLKIAIPENIEFGQRRLKKLAGPLNEEWIQRYHEIKK
jgi:LPS sulfotransferase NodH